jgi:2-pyrone-4,6-dicarboxylate lactonase
LFVDCHFHVIGSATRFPFHSARSYTPAEASLADWRQALAPLGITQGVAVQPSVYGTDNSALLSALTQAEGQLVGVGAALASISDAELDALVHAGVRGLRFAHFEAGDPRALPGFVPLRELVMLAPRMRERQLHADLFTDSRLLGSIAPTLRAAGVPVVIDHMGRTPAALGIAHDGVPQLRHLLEEGWCWVKLSGLANVSSQPPLYDDAHPMHTWLVEHFAERLVWGSDWPHTRPNGQPPQTHAIFERFMAWTPSKARQTQILATNAGGLYCFNQRPIGVGNSSAAPGSIGSRGRPASPS